MRKGDIVEVTFFDHSQNTEDPLLFTVWGRLCKKGRKNIVIQTWGHPKDMSNDNQTEYYSIIKSCIVESSVLRSG